MILRKISNIQSDAKFKGNFISYILAKGEATGHDHRVKGYALSAFDFSRLEIYEKDGVLYIKNEKTVIITHEEHKPITLEPGLWEVGRVNEYDPFLEEIREVVD